MIFLALIFSFFSFASCFFFPYSYNKNELTRCIDCVYGPIEFKHKFILANKTINKIQIHLDGFVTFEQCENFHNCSNAIIIYQINATSAGYIFFEEISNLHKLIQLADNIKIYTNNNFSAIWAYQITWFNIFNTRYDFKERSSFQMVLIRSLYKSYAIFNYVNLATNKNIFIGYKSNNIQIIQNMTTYELSTESNINRKGIWVIDLNTYLAEKNSANKLYVFLSYFFWILFIKN